VFFVLESSKKHINLMLNVANFNEIKFPKRAAHLILPNA
jgi:hypothetical protein